MAPISRTLVLAALAAMISAMPMNKPRQPDVVTETTWTTVDVPVTLWVDENGTPLSTVVSGGNFATVPPTPSSVSSTTTPTPVAEASSLVAPPPSPSTTLVTATASVVQQQVDTAIPTSAPAASSVAPVPAAPTSAVPAAAAPVSSANQGSIDASAISASSSNSCSGTGAACSGDITYWEGGMGACGWNINTNSDFQIALPWEYMGPQSNGNKYCGQPLTIRNPTTGQTVQATVGDKCMGCTGRSIDLTSALFNAIGGGCDGRCTGFEWWF